MKRTNAFWLSLVLAPIFACAPILAQAAPQNSTEPPLPPKPDVQNIPAENAVAVNVKKTISGPYRITYTLTENDGTKRIGSQHYAVVLDADARPSHMNVQSSIPVEFSAPGGSPKHVERMKAEMRIDANLQQFANGMELSTLIGQDTFVNGANNVTLPITRQSFFRSTVLLSENKPVTIGQFDMPGSTHSLQIRVELARIH